MPSYLRALIYKNSLVCSVLVHLSDFATALLLEAGIETEMVYGLNRYDITIPHVWLTIDAHAVDNTFIDCVSETFVYPIALRKAKIAYNFGLSGCNRVKM